MLPSLTAPSTRQEVPPRVVLAVVLLVNVLVSMDLPMVGVALPYLPSNDRLYGFFDIIWCLTAVSLPLAILLTAQVLRSEARGRKRLVLAGLLGYALGAAVAAMTQSIATLVLARMIQGTCVMAIAGALAICVNVPNQATRTRRVGMWGATTVIGLGLGPFVGALLLSLGSWRFIFGLQCALALILLFVARWALVESRAAVPPHVPRVGLRLIGITAITVGLWGINGALQRGVNTVDVGFMIVGGATAALWIWTFRRRPPQARSVATPEFRPNLATTFIGLTIGAGIGASTLADFFFLSSILNLDPTWVALGVLPILAGGMPVGAITRLAGGQHGSRMRLIVGVTISVLGLVLIIIAWNSGGITRVSLGTALVGVLIQFVGIGMMIIALGELRGILVTERLDRIFRTSNGDRARLVAGTITWILGLALLLLMSDEGFTTFPAISTALISLLLQGTGIGLAITAIGRLEVNRSQRREWLAAQVGSGIAARLFGATIGFFALVALASGHLPSNPIVATRAWIFAIVMGVLVIGFTIVVGSEFRLPDVESQEPVLDLRSLTTASLPVIETTPATAREIDPFRDVPLFTELSEDNVRALRAASQTVFVPAGDDLITAGDPARALFVVRSGRLVTRVEGAITAVHARGGLIGEADVFGDGTSAGTVTAVRDSSLMSIPSTAFSRAASANVYRRLASTLAVEVSKWETHANEESSPIARDAVVAVIGLESGLPVDAVRDAIAGGIARWRSVVVPGLVNRLALEQAEQDAEHVVLSASHDDHEWRDFCVRSADRIVLVTCRASPPAHSNVAWHGADVLIIDTVPTNAQWSAWETAIHPEYSRTTSVNQLVEDCKPIADRIAGRSIGLALGGGGAKGLAHIGVIEVLTEAGLSFDRVSGTSQGAIVGSLYAAGLSPEQIDALAYEMLVRNNPMNDFTIPRNSILRGRRIDAALQGLFGDLVIEALPRTFRCVSVDLVSRSEVVHRSGRVSDAVAASSRLPGILPVYPHPSGGLHVDGGLLNNLPVSTLPRKNGPVIAVEVGGRNELAARIAAGEKPQSTSIAETVMRSLMMASDNANEDAIRRAAVHIRPDTDAAGLTEFYRLDVMREAGRAAALAALPNIAALLS